MRIAWLQKTISAELWSMSWAGIAIVVYVFVSVSETASERSPCVFGKSMQIRPFACSRTHLVNSQLSVQRARVNALLFVFAHNSLPQILFIVSWGAVFKSFGQTNGILREGASSIWIANCSPINKAPFAPLRKWRTLLVLI